MNMCDIWIAMSHATEAQHIIVGKNSDRPIFDCQPLLLHPQQEWPQNSSIQLEYVELPQAQVTFATLGSSPYWCWGYEEGINEYSVVIGNEAIFTKTFRQATQAHRNTADLGLLGMDLIRLALERSQNARQAVDLMGHLVEQYGQFGSGVPMKEHAVGGYDNSFIVADPNEAWIVEAVGRRWAAKRITHAFDSISNQPSIRTEWDRGSSDLEAYAIRNGWWSDSKPSSFDFARAYIDDRVPRQVSHIRSMRSKQLLKEQNGRITPQSMMRIARDHYEDTFLHGPYFDAADPDFLSLCMHASPADFTWGNTASSCIAVLPKSPDALPVFWWSAGPPCNGCFVPFFVHGSKLPAVVSRAGTFGKRVVPPDQAGEDQFAPDSYWWLFRQLMDKVKGDPIKSIPRSYPSRNRIVRERFDAIEQECAAELPHVLQKAADSTSGYSLSRAEILDEFTAKWMDRVVRTLRELLIQFN
jgi:secernin